MGCKKYLNLLFFTGLLHAQEQSQLASRFVDSIGVDVHLSYVDTAYGNASLVEQEVQRLGVKHLRDGYDSYAFPSVLRLGRQGVRFTFNVQPPYTPAILNKAIHATTENGTRYMESWEGQNELDVNSSTWQVDLPRNFTALNAANSAHLDIWGPPLAYATNAARLEPLTASYGTFHPYPAGQNPSTLFPRQLDLIKPLFPTSPIIASETGYHYALNDHRDQPAIDLNTGRKYIPRLLLESFNAGVYRTYIYELLDERSSWNTSLQDINSNCEQCNWGLVTAGGLEKPSFTAVQNLISILGRDDSTTYLPAQLTFAISGGTNIHHLLLQKVPGIFDLVLWQDVPSWNPDTQTIIRNEMQNVTLSLQARSLTAYLPSQSLSGTAMYLNNGSVQLSVPDEPLVIEIVATAP